MSVFSPSSPLEHFEINIVSYLYFLRYDFSVNSASLYLLSLIVFLCFFFVAADKAILLFGRAQIALESVFLTIFYMFKEQTSSVRVLRFFPIMFTLFLLIFLLNFSSLFSFGVSLTGHIMVTSFFSFIFFLTIIFIGFLNHDLDFFKLFVPQNVPNFLLDFLIIIEVFSFLIRPFSLSIRLFANMLAGHTLLGIFAQFGAYILKNYFLFIFLPISLLVIIFFLEIAVSIIQAYIFVSLLCIYLNDMVILH